MAKNTCYFTRGKAYIKQSTGCCEPNTWEQYFGCSDSSVESLGRYLGSLQTLQLNIDQEFLGQSIYGDLKEVPTCARTVTREVGVTIIINSISEENLLLSSLASKRTEIANGSVVDVKLDNGCKGAGYNACDYFAFKYSGADLSSVILKDENGTIFEEGKDYKLTETGVELNRNIASQKLYLSYNYSGSTTYYEHLTDDPKTYEISFVGANYAGCSDDNFIVKLHKVQLQANPTFNYLSQDGFWSLTLTGFLLRDTTKTGDRSQFYQTKKY